MLLRQPSALGCAPGATSRAAWPLARSPWSYPPVRLPLRWAQDTCLARLKIHWQGQRRVLLQAGGAPVSSGRETSRIWTLVPARRCAAADLPLPAGLVAGVQKRRQVVQFRQDFTPRFSWREPVACLTTPPPRPAGTRLEAARSTLRPARRCPRVWSSRPFSPRASRCGQALMQW